MHTVVKVNALVVIRIIEVTICIASPRQTADNKAK